MLQNLSEGARQAGLAIDISRRIESVLEAQGATGKGLHEKISSIESTLPDALVTKMRFIASVRNKIVHEDELLSEDEMAAFAEAGKHAQDALEKMGAAGKPARARSQRKERKTSKPRRAPASKGKARASAGAALRLGGGVLIAGVALVLLLVLLGNEGSALWTGAFCAFFLLGGYFLKRLRRISAELANDPS